MPSSHSAHRIRNIHIMDKILPNSITIVKQNPLFKFTEMIENEPNVRPNKYITAPYRILSPPPPLVQRQCTLKLLNTNTVLVAWTWPPHQKTIKRVNKPKGSKTSSPFDARNLRCKTKINAKAHKKKRIDGRFGHSCRQATVTVTERCNPITSCTHEMAINIY